MYLHPNPKPHTHRARPSLAQDWGYARPVATPENRAAHGNITRQDVCTCGARRLTNINGRHVERGNWQEPVTPLYDDA